MYGKKIFPLVKDGKLMNNYMKYTHDSKLAFIYCHLSDCDILLQGNFTYC